ncbi:MAG: hypothetical protein JW844_05610 [Candidatus Omnitrophica bacterium]|nr:hypothetical protein [Candidatus Omnitrophota bacterium]
MKRLIFCCILIALCMLGVVGAGAQESGEHGRLLLLREAKENEQGTTVAVETYLVDTVLEATVIVRMEAARPRIFNALVVGPKIGRVSSATKEVLDPTVEEEEPFPTTKRGGFISFGDREETKKAKGAVIKELIRFKLPADKIVAHEKKKYELWIKVQGIQRHKRIQSFAFVLEDLPEKLSQE